MKEINDFPGYFACEDGRIWSEKRGKFLSPGKTRDGYLKVGLMRDGKQFSKSVHRLVATAFIPNPMGKPMIDHRDCDKTNNSVENLRWLTSQDNIRAAWANGLNESIRDANSKRVRCLETGQEFRSAADASRSLGKNNWAVAGAIRQGCRCAGYTWEYVS